MAIQKTMNDELTAFVLSRTEEEIDQLVKHLPELLPLLETQEGIAELRRRYPTLPPLTLEKIRPCPLKPSPRSA